MRQELQAKWYCHDSHHLAIEKYNRRPVAGDGILLLGYHAKDLANLSNNDIH